MTVAVVEASNSGRLRRWGQEAYATIHDAASGDSVTNNAAVLIGQSYTYDVPEWFDVNRGGLEFSLASIPTGATIISATLSLYGQADGSDTDFTITVVSGADLATTLVLADYGDLLNDTVSRGGLTSVGLLLEAYNTFGLNDTGISDIQSALAGGVIRFGLRSSRDINSNTPKLDSTDADEYVTFYGSNTANKKPKLTITYTTPSTFIPKIVII